MNFKLQNEQQKYKNFLHHNKNLKNLFYNYALR